jgi:predicted ArsR family transcriptional regulator
VSAMAVRQHLYALHEEHLVTYHQAPRPRGRPIKRWQLTPAADRLFPEAYAELTLSLLTSITEAFGKPGLERLLALRSRRQVDAYRTQMRGRDSLPQRLAALAAIRTDEGYMAEVQPQADGSFVLLEKHCPNCAAAVACTGLCGKELEVFQEVLGEDVMIERTEHIVAGARRCAYRVSSRGGLGKPAKERGGDRRRSHHLGHRRPGSPPAQSGLVGRYPDDPAAPARPQ